MIKKGDVFQPKDSDFTILITADEKFNSDNIEWEPNSWVLDIPSNTSAKCFIPRNELLANYIKVK